MACFDTAFHHDQPPVAQAFALPRALTERACAATAFTACPTSTSPRCCRGTRARGGGRTVVAHLGNGASMCAMRGGQERGDTMGFTALDGLLMGTRCGALDPGVLLYLMSDTGWTPRAIEALLYKRVGAARRLRRRRATCASCSSSPRPARREAIDLFVYRIGRELGSLAAALGGLDALVFTAGIGEHAAPVRARGVPRCGMARRPTR